MIPESIRINGVNYNIVNNDSLNDSGTVLLGNCNHCETLISLNGGVQSDEYKRVTLWHEIFHAVCNTNKVELGEQEEKVVDSFAFAINQILADNKEKILKMY